METIKLTIDNKEVEVEKGTTILKAARQLGIEIPTLCYLHLEDLNIENKPGYGSEGWGSTSHSARTLEG